MNLKIIIISTSLIFNVLIGICQNVNIPDSKLKSQLVADININTNQDGEISIAEAEAFTGTFTAFGSFSQHISDVTGIEAFKNITKIQSTSPWIDDTLDLRQCTQLQSISLSQGAIDAIDIRGLTNLKKIWMYVNLKDIFLAANTNLDTASFLGNNFDTLDFSEAANLLVLTVRESNLNTLLLDCPKLKSLNLEDNQVSAIDLSKSPLLVDLELTKNNLSTLNVNSNPLIESLSISDNNFISIDISSLNQLTKFYCFDNALTALDISNNNLIDYFLSFNNPQLAQICVSNVTLIESLETTDFEDFDDNGGFIKDSTSTWSESCLTSSNDINLSLEYYPNPAASLFHIKLPTNVSIQVFDVLGNQIYKENNIKEFNYKLDVENYKNGLYFIQVISADFDSKETITLVVRR